MTVMAAEAVDDVTASESAGSSLAQTQQQRLNRQQPPPQPSGNGQNPQRQNQSYAGPSITLGGGRSYHRWVMAEFVGCVLLTGVTPLLSRPKNADGTEVNLDAKAVLFGADALVRLSALSLVFLILALLANNEKSGKFAAAFGGLILAGLLINTDPGIWTKIGDVFGGQVGSGTQPAQSGSSSSGKSPSNISQYIQNLPSEIRSAAESALKNLISWG